ncbi:3-deoxy-D-manno-octulosonic acid transferase [Thermosulfuriphilus sp.]
MIFLHLYRTLSWSLLPLVRIKGLKRSHRDIVSQRLAPDLSRAPQGAIWVHALSVGEVGAGLSFIRVLRKSFSGEVILSVSTPWGLTRARETAQKLVSYVFAAPYDLPHLVRKSLEKLRPRLFVLMETDLWPNLLWDLKGHQVPLILLNARLSPRSAERLRLLRPLARLLYGAFDLILAASEADRGRFCALGFRQTGFVGNIKYDLSPPDPDKIATLAQELPLSRPIIVAGSTHPGEEEIILRAYLRLKASLPGASLILCPRHPERALDILRLVESLGLKGCLRSRFSPGVKVVVIDTMGELWALYGLGDVAFVGGTFAPLGGHNLLEPAALRVPVTFGPSLSSVIEIAGELSASGGGIKVEDPERLWDAWQSLLTRREEAAQAARFVYLRHQGATQRAVEALGRFLT